MKKKFKLGVIGCGFMGSAIIKGVVLSDFLNAKKIIVADLNESTLDKIDELGVYTCNSNKYVAENSEYLLIAVEPKNFRNVVSSLGGYKPEKIISVMAGIEKQTIKEYLGLYTIKVARCMPNLPCSIGSGAVGIDMSDFDGDSDDSEFIFNIFNNLGVVLSTNESKMDAIASISGSGPAYAFMFIDSLIDAGVQQGLTKDEAKILAVQTVLGAAEMVQRDDEPLSELIMRVCTKGGTTIEAVKVFEENHFRGIVSKAVGACMKRTKELSE